MAVRIALRRSREDSARPMAGSVWRDSIASVHRALGSFGAGSSRSREPSNLPFHITGPAECESHRDWCARHGKERMRADKARLATGMAAAEAADTAARAAAEERARLAREQNRVVRAMAGLPPKKERVDSDGSDSFGNEQIRLNPYCVFDWYFREKDGNGA